MEMVPGDCAERYLAYKNTQGQNLTLEDIDAERARLGLDQPFLYRWVSWVSGAFVGDFGESCILRVSISQLLGSKFLISAGICFAALFLAYLIAVPVGIYAAASRNPVVNNILRFVSYLGLALPNFLLALIIMLISTIYFGDSLSGLFSKEFRDAPWSMAKFWDFMSRAWLPIFILGWSATAFALQTVRALMLDEQSKLYVTAARARGALRAAAAVAVSGAARFGADRELTGLRLEPDLQRIAHRCDHSDPDRGGGALAGSACAVE